MSYYVYLLLCEDGSFYTGYTKNLDLRMKLHMNGKGARYTRLRRPKKLVYTEEFNSISQAMKREKRIKRLSHHQKLGLAKQHRSDSTNHNVRLRECQRRVAGRRKNPSSSTR
jgi:putative endonuclease